ncbi:hypothetical protein H0H81_000656 [Sphagnurus paluster]|uniref:Uncharacterized protein n=1 Tax=Sphagnurus paluster TaxID=117069 RepID=A0A9P7K954_9AGAR|nr:hypothetical protein H0H81_000656 [Sphagnurus paluster]
MRGRILSILATCALASTAATPPAELFSPLIPQKVLAAFKALPNPIKYPQYTTTTGTWQFFSPDTWTSGFFPVTGYEVNTRRTLCGATPANGLGSADWVALARAASNGLISLENGNGQGHDQGFLSFPFVEELLLNPNNATAKTAILAFSKILSGRFNSVVGATRSWDSSDPNNFQVIIDNMMNLELLFHAANLTGDASLIKIATTHADTTIKNHIRDDGNQNYLVTARRLAKYFLDNIPSDGIVPWDFNAPLTPAPRPADSSAATIAANGLLLLAKYETSSTAAQSYTDSAIDVRPFHQLGQPFHELTHPLMQLLNKMTGLAWNPSWQSLLSNGTVNKPANNQLTGTVYGA